MNALSKFVREMRRRRVFRSAGLYIVGAWVLLQVVDLAFESFGIPNAMLRYLWIVAVAAFVPALVIFWRYDITSDGIKRTPPPNADDQVNTTLDTTDYVILTAVAVVMIVIVAGTINQVSDDITTNSGPWYAGGDNVERVAVLPLENLSAIDGQGFLAAGLHDALISTLSRINRFRVTSRFSSMRVDAGSSLEDIRKRLGGIDRIITGSVARDEELVRVNVSLVDAESGETLWNESYTRELAGLIDVQAEIASSIAREVNLVLTPEQAERLRPSDKPDDATYEAYLKGMAQLRKGNPRGYRNAINILTEAVENAPTSALAYAGLAIAYSQLGHSPFPVAGAYPRAREAAQRALEYDPNLPEAYLAIGMYKMYYEWDFAGAEEAFQRAFDLNPSLVDAHYHYAWLLELWKRDEEAILHGEYTAELNPLSPFYSSWLAEQYRDAGRYDDAIELVTTTQGLNPNYPVTWLVLGETYSNLERFDEAVAAHEKLKGNAFWGFAYPATLAAAGRREEALAERALFEEKRRNAFTDTLLNAGLGDIEATIASLEEARDEKIPWYPWLVNYFPQTAEFRQHPVIMEHAAAIDIPLESSERYAAD